MLKIHIKRPKKTAKRYEFQATIEGIETAKTTFIDRLKSTVTGHGKNTGNYRRFGYEALNFKINHCELWDSIYPMMYMIRNGGPLYRSGHTEAEIYFNYPILEAVKEFFIHRAANFGFTIKIFGSAEYNKKFDITTTGRSLAFGGGKDSRLLYGLLLELGYNPTVYMGGRNIPISYAAGRNIAKDIPEAKKSRPLSGVLTDRVMPALMSKCRIFYFGSSLDEVALQVPWQQYYDLASFKGSKEFSMLLNELGIEMDFQSPVSVLPSNLIQKILYERYPELYKYQKSMRKQEENEKNLHVSLLKLYHDIDFSDHCSDELFQKLLKRFVRKQISNPESFGFHRHREVFRREMRSIIYAKRNHPLIHEIHIDIPAEWKGQWFNYIHSYTSQNLDQNILRIYKKYAQDIESYDNRDKDFKVPA